MNFYITVTVWQNYWDQNITEINTILFNETIKDPYRTSENESWTSVSLILIE